MLGNSFRFVKRVPRAVLLFFFIELVLYSSFMYMDISGYANYDLISYLKFAGIILCFIFTLFIHNWQTDKIDNLLLCSALLFTVISDLFLLLLDKFSVGIFTFCIVQLVYLIRILRFEFQSIKFINVMKRLLPNIFLWMVILILCKAINISLEMEIVLVTFYFVAIVHNMMKAIESAAKTRVRQQVIFATGLVLFVLCDINVGIFNLSGFIDVSFPWFMKLYQFSTVAMWMFYLPAQVLIVLSGIKRMNQY